ncbi:MAG: hypothetical protein Q7N50_13020 [Armatimonadota bacterium]|nr:hypothetical protein [Armatimonadota bacterium]
MLRIREMENGDIFRNRRGNALHVAIYWPRCPANTGGMCAIILALSGKNDVDPSPAPISEGIISQTDTVRTSIHVVTEIDVGRHHGVGGSDAKYKGKDREERSLEHISTSLLFGALVLRIACFSANDNW